MKVLVNKFLPPPRRIFYHPLNNTHKNEIKHKILMFHYIDHQYPIFIIPAGLNDPTTRNKSSINHYIYHYILVTQDTIVMTFLVRECYGSPKKQEF